MKQEIGGGVVAIFNCSGAESGEGHPSLVNVLPRDRRMLKEVGFGVGNEAGELLLFLIDPMEDGGGGKKLESAAHREALTGAVLKASTTSGIDGGDT